MSKAILALLGVGAIAGIGFAIHNAKAAESGEGTVPSLPPPQAVTASSGNQYLVQMIDQHDSDQGTVLTFIVSDPQGNYILTYTQFQGDNDHRFLVDDSRENLSGAAFIQAAKDFSVFASSSTV